tara:strand:- start:303 stop:545 length:243 start_codon:yes stop_codon:yes gene_type:complete
MMEACMKGINAEVMRITDRINKIESVLDNWERTREPMIFTEPDMALLSSASEDMERMQRRVDELKEEKEILENEMPRLRN